MEIIIIVYLMALVNILESPLLPSGHRVISIVKLMSLTRKVQFFPLQNGVIVPFYL